MNNYIKPTGLTSEYAAQFKDRAIVRAYQFREPYSPHVFSVLAELACRKNPRVLDIGCGSGDLTVGLSDFAAQVDAVDFSGEMLEEARAVHGGRANIRWIQSAVEHVMVEGPYDLVTSAQSFHWMDWSAISKKIGVWLRPGGYLALVARQYADRSWWNADLQAIIDEFSTNREFQKYDLVEEVRRCGLFSVQGDVWTPPVHFEQKVSDLVESFHSRNGFSRERMSPENALAFDRKASEHLMKFANAGKMSLSAVSRVTWMTV